MPPKANPPAKTARTRRSGPAPTPTTPLSHFDEGGRARMVDVSAKPETARTATATGRVTMKPATLARILAGTAGKGDVLGTARLAGIQAAKKTADLIPLCHPLAIAGVTVDFAPDRRVSAIDITATCKVAGRTGVEMEALTAVAVAALTVYDMAKAIDREMTLGEIRLIEKTGGKSGRFRRPAPRPRTAGSGAKTTPRTGKR